MISTIEQTPYLNIFRHFKVQEKGKKEGNVKYVVDKTIGRQVYKLAGRVIQAHSLTIPSALTDSLGVPGPYLYIQYMAAPGKLFVMHVLLQTVGGLVVDVSISNMYKSIKHKGTALHIPAHATGKWGTVVIDMPALLEAHTTFKFMCLKGFQFCANMCVRTAFSSQSLYRSNAKLPKDFLFPKREGLAYDSLYEFEALPSLPPAQQNGKAYKIAGNLSLENADNNSVHPDVEVLHAASIQPLLCAERVIGGSGNGPQAVAWGGDNKTVYYACGANILSQHTETGEQRLLQGHSAAVNQLAMSHDGSLLASNQIGPNPIIRIWSVHAGAISAVVGIQGSSLQCMSFARNSLTLLCVVNEGSKQTVSLWDLSVVASGRPRKMFGTTLEQPVARIVFCPWEDSQLVSCGPNAIRLLRIGVRGSGFRSFAVPLGPYASHKHTFTDIAFDASLTAADVSNRRFYASTSTGMLFQFSYATQALEYIWQLHDNTAILSIGLSSGSGYFVTAGKDGAMRVWTTDFTSLLMTAPLESAVVSVAVSTDGTNIALASEQGTIGCLNYPKHHYRTITRSHHGAINHISCDPTNPEMATCGEDSTVRIWDLQTYDQILDFSARADAVVSHCYHPENYQLAVGFSSGAVRVFDLMNTSVDQEVLPHSGPVTQVVFSPDGNFLYSAAEDGQVAAIDAQRSFNIVRVAVTAEPKDERCMAVSPDGRLIIATGPHSQSIIVLSPKTLTRLAVISPAKSVTVKALAFADRGKRIVALAANRAFCWEVPADINDWRSIRLLWQSPRLSPVPITSFAASSTAHLVAAGCADGMVRVLHVSGQYDPSQKVSFQTQSFCGHLGEVKPLAFSTDGSQLISSSKSSGMIVWDVNVEGHVDESAVIEDALLKRQVEENHMQEPSESPIPAFPVIGGRQSGLEAIPIEEYKQRLSALEDGNARDSGSVKQQSSSNQQDSGPTPSPLHRVRNRMQQLDLSASPLPDPKIEIEIQDSNSDRHPSAQLHSTSIGADKPSSFLTEVPEPADAVDTSLQGLGGQDSSSFTDNDDSSSKESSAEDEKAHMGDEQLGQATATQSTALSSLDLLDELGRARARRTSSTSETQEAQAVARSFESLPNVHFRPRFASSSRAILLYVAGEDAAYQQQHTIGYNGKGSHSAQWLAAKELVVRSVGCSTVIQRLSSSQAKTNCSAYRDVNALSVAPDGKSVVTAVTEPFGPRIRSDSSASDDSFLTSTEKASSIISWDVESGAARAMSSFHPLAVQALCHSSNSDVIVTVGVGHTPYLAVWRAADLSRLDDASLTSAVNDVAWISTPSSADGSPGMVERVGGEFVTCGASGVQFWMYTANSSAATSMSGGLTVNTHLASEEIRPINLMPGAHCTTIAVSSNGQHVVVGDSNGGVSAWSVSLEGNECVSTLQAMQSEVECIALAPDGMITGGKRPHVRVWRCAENLTGWTALQDIFLDAGPVSISIPDLSIRQALIGTSGNSLWQVNTTSGDGSQLEAGPCQTVTAMAWSPLCSCIATGDDTGGVDVWDPLHAELTWRFMGKKGDDSKYSPVVEIVFTSEFELAVISADGEVRLVSLSEELKHVSSLPLPPPPTLASCSRLLFKSRAQIDAAIGSEDGEVIYIASQGVVSGYHLDSAASAQVCALASGVSRASSMARSHVESNRFVCAQSDGTLTVFRTFGGGLQGEVEYSGPVDAAADILSMVPSAGPRLVVAWSLLEPNVVMCGGHAVGQGLQLFDVVQGKLVGRISFDQVVTCLDTSPAQSEALVGTSELIVKIISYQKQAISQVSTSQNGGNQTVAFQDYTGPSDVVMVSKFSPHGVQFASASAQEIHIWEQTAK